MKKCFLLKLSPFSVQTTAVVSEGERKCAPVLWLFYLQESNGWNRLQSFIKSSGVTVSDNHQLRLQFKSPTSQRWSHREKGEGKPWRTDDLGLIWFHFYFLLNPLSSFLWESLHVCSFYPEEKTSKKKKLIIFLLSWNWHTHHPLSSSSRPFLSPLFTFSLWPPWQRRRGCHRDRILHPPGEWLCRGWWARGESLCSTTNIITITSPASRLNLRWHGHCPHANTQGTHTHPQAWQHRHAANTRSKRKVCPVHLTNPFCPPLPRSFT